MDKEIKLTNHFLHPYINVIYNHIAMKPIAIANNAQFNAFSHNVGLTFSSCIKINGAGNAQSFN
jgi:hypothetical protein